MKFYIPQHELKCHTSNQVEIQKAMKEITGQDHPFYWWNRNRDENKAGYVEIQFALGDCVAILQSAHCAGNDVGVIRQKCPCCHTDIFIKVPVGIAASIGTNYIQELLPRDTPELREVFISGLCFACQPK